jgi:hypothetical protein
MHSSYVTTKESISICLTEILDLAGMCWRLMMLLQSDASGHGHMALYNEYKQILRNKDLNRQFIADIEYQCNVLGCINPRYRGAKPLKFGLHSREILLAMCNVFKRTNVISNYVPTLIDCKSFPLNTHHRVPSMEKFELLPKEATQTKEYNFVFRPVIEFNFVDTFSQLYQAIVAVSKSRTNQ